MTEKPVARQFNAAAAPDADNAQQRLEILGEFMDSVRTTANATEVPMRGPGPERAEPEAIVPDPSEGRSDLQEAFRKAVLDTQVTPDTVSVTYRAHLEKHEELVRYTWDQAKQGKVKWAKYFKMRALSEHVPAKVTQLLALLKYPELFCEYWVQVDDSQGARVWAYVYANMSAFDWLRDQEGNLILDANGSMIPGGDYLARDVKQVRAGSRSDDEGGGGGDYLEKAITGARQRALKQLGLGTAAGIAALEDVQADERQDTRALVPSRTKHQAQRPSVQEPEPEHVSQDPDDAPQRVQQGGSMAQEAEKFRAWQREREAKTENARGRFLEYLGTRSKVLTRAEVEQVYGPVQVMDVDTMKRAHTELEQIRSRAKWEQVLVSASPAEAWKRWREWPGGVEAEQAQGYLQAIHDALPEDAGLERQVVLDAIKAAGTVNDDLALMPASQQLDQLVQQLLPALEGFAVLTVQP